jgi:uncharacterized membrane protein YsdA (DUF1294 family)/cold shock CspA family protein
METGRIIAWDRSKGYGYVESGQRRLFLHIRDFAERHKVPALGDTIIFSIGTDRKGRPCAVRAAHQNDGGRIRSVHLAVLVALLIAPGIAALRVTGKNESWFLAGWYALASAATFAVYVFDKRRAKSGGWREPETMLHLSELAGGWPGAFLAQQHLRHKCSKLSFQVVFWFIVATHQFVAIDYLLGWRMTHAAWAAIGNRP